MSQAAAKIDMATDTRALILEAPAILLDWDGCIAVADVPSDAALRFIARHAGKVAILSNNSTLLPADISDILARGGVELSPDRIILAGAEAVARAAASAPASTLILGDSRMRAYARSLGANLERDAIEIVVLLRDRRFSYPRLERAANALARGARLIVANPDLVHPGPKGAIVPETGALLAALAACVDLSTIACEIIGKPSPALFLKACAALGARPEDALMIGDNIATDIRGAEALGMRAILVSPQTGLAFDEEPGPGSGKDWPPIRSV